MKALAAMLLVCAGLFAFDITATSRASGQQAELTAAQAERPWYQTDEIRLDESTGTKKPTPTIPQDWRFVGVSSGGGNVTHLWFQLPDGRIALVSGFDGEGKFTLVPYLQFLARK